MMQHTVRDLVTSPSPEAEDNFCFSASAPTLSFFLLSEMRYTRLLAFTNMDVLESRNSHPDGYNNRRMQSNRHKKD